MALPHTPQELTEFISILNTTGRASGQKVRAVSTVFADSWSRIEQQAAASEPVDQQHEGQIQPFEIIIPWIDGVKAWMSIRWGSPARQLDIVDVGQKIFVRPEWQLMVIHATEYSERDVRE